MNISEVGMEILFWATLLMLMNKSQLVPNKKLNPMFSLHLPHNFLHLSLSLESSKAQPEELAPSFSEGRIIE